MGLVNIYRFLVVRSRRPAGLPLDAAAISQAALAASDELASEAPDLMVSIFGAQAANLALTVMSRGGIYLGGGIPPKILPRLLDGGFMQAFLGKGRLSPLLGHVPIQVILNEQTALIGAALCAET